jgi:hypothetical protein
MRKEDMALRSISTRASRDESRAMDAKCGDLAVEVEALDGSFAEAERVRIVPFSPWMLSILMIIPAQLSGAEPVWCTLGLNLQDRPFSARPRFMSTAEEKRSSTGILRSIVGKQRGIPKSRTCYLNIRSPMELTGVFHVNLGLDFLLW